MGPIHMVEGGQDGLMDVQDDKGLYSLPSTCGIFLNHSYIEHP